MVANESYGYGDSRKFSPEVVASSSEAGPHFRLAVPRSPGDPVGIRGSQVVKTTSNASWWSE